jgi:phosphatidylglycerophosphate synthase
MRLSLITYLLLNTLLHFRKLFSTVCRCWEEANEKQNREKKRRKKPTTALSIPSSSFMLCCAHWAEMTYFLANIVNDIKLCPRVLER